MTWIQTYTGKPFDIFEPDQMSINLWDIAHSLANQARFNGHTMEFYSVAQHSIIVSRLVPNHLDMEAIGLLHDASEAYIGDLVRPIKKSMPSYVEVEEKIQRLIFKLATQNVCASTAAATCTLGKPLQELELLA